MLLVLRGKQVGTLALDRNRGDYQVNLNIGYTVTFKRCTAATLAVRL